MHAHCTISQLYLKFGIRTNNLTIKSTCLLFITLRDMLTHYVPGYLIKKNTKKGSIVIYYHVNSIGSEYNWTHKDCSQMRTVGYNGLRASSLWKLFAVFGIRTRGLLTSQTNPLYPLLSKVPMICAVFYRINCEVFIVSTPQIVY